MAINRYTPLKLVNKKFIETMEFPSSQTLQRADDIIMTMPSEKRIDQLAFEFFGDGSLWWVICMVNSASTPFDEKFLPGRLVRIPTSINHILDSIESVNS